MRARLLLILVFINLFVLISCSKNNTKEDIKPIVAVTGGINYSSEKPVATEKINNISEKPTELSQNKTFFSVISGIVLAGNLNGKWIEGKEAENSISSKDVFKFYSLNGFLGTGSEAKIEKYENGSTIKVKQDFKSSITSEKFFSYYLHELGISGTWNAIPRIPEIQKGNLETYENVVKDILIKKGLKDSKADIKRIIRIDMDGNGTEEVLLTATDWDLDAWNTSAQQSGKGTYSIVLLRKIINGKVENIVVKEDYANSASEAARVYYTPFALDLDGDGNMEFIVEGRINAWSELEFYKVEGSNAIMFYSTTFGA